MKCLIEECENKRIYSRGLCLSHYHMTQRLVNQKKRTWEEFEKVGMALKAQRGRTSKQSKLFVRMLKKKFPNN